MSKVMESIAGICVLIIAVEILGRLCPKNSVLQFVKGLVVLAVILSAVGALFSVELDFTGGRRETERTQEELSSFIEQEYRMAAEQEMVEYLKGLLAAGGMTAEKIKADITIQESERIVLTKVSASFSYAQDAQRARVLLENALGDGIEIEVAVDGA